MVTRIILVRHGETDWNKEGRYQGQIDTKLSQKGYEQARLLGKGLKNVAIDAIYSSPLSRAYETANSVALHHGLAIEVLDGLTEINHGKWEGLLSDEVRLEWGSLVDMWQNEPHQVLMPEGEDLERVQKRAVEALYKIVEENPGKTVLVASHDATNKALLSHILETELKNFWQLKQDNTCINVIERINDKWRLCLFNDTCHLGQKFFFIEQKAL